MGGFSGWVVAAAIMVLEGGAWHYETLTNRVLKTDLSGLGSRGGKWERATLRVEMTKDHGDLFCPTLRAGYYELRDEALALKNSDIRMVISILLRNFLDEYRQCVLDCAHDHMIVQKTERPNHKQIQNFERIFHRITGIQDNPTENKRFGQND